MWSLEINENFNLYSILLCSPSAWHCNACTQGLLPDKEDQLELSAMNSQLLNSVPEAGDFFINREQEPGTSYSCLMVFTQYGICTVRRLYVLPRA